MLLQDFIDKVIHDPVFAAEIQQQALNASRGGIGSAEWSTYMENFAESPGQLAEFEPPVEPDPEPNPWTTITTTTTTTTAGCTTTTTTTTTTNYGCSDEANLRLVIVPNDIDLDPRLIDFGQISSGNIDS